MATNINFTNDLNSESDANISYNLPRKIYRNSLKRAVAAGATAEAESCTYNIMLDMDYERLLNRASLLVTPTLYKEGVLYPQIPTYNSNGDFSVTRATTATRVNAAGLVELVPYNLLTYSEIFTNSIWAKNFSTISANVAIAPNGTLTADKLIPNTTNNFHSVGYQFILNPTFTTTTFSAYMKADGYNYGNLLIVSGSGFSNFLEVIFNLQNGTIENTGRSVGGYVGTSSIESVGNGWYRCSVTVTNTILNTTHSVFITTQPTNNPNVSYAGDGTSGILVWGAQFEMGALTTYQATETRLNIPRLDYSLGSCPNILLEPQRTNLALRSEEFQNAYWVKANVSVTANSAASPSGIINADKIIPNTSLTFHSVVTPYNISVSGGSITASVYLKADGYNFAKLIIPRDAAYTSYYRVIFNLSNGTIESSTGVNYVGTQSITSVGNGWYRCVVAVTNAATNNTHGLEIGSLSTGVDVSYIGNGTSGTLSWGAQLEAGAYATSYIPTTSASVTRNADVISRGNIFTNGLITASGGTWFVDIRNNIARTRDAQTFFGVGDTSALTTNSLFLIPPAGAAGRYLLLKAVSGSFTSLYTTLTDTAKIAIKWNGTTADVFVNGVKVVSATAFTTTNMQFLNSTGAGNPININSMALFPTPLTDGEMSMLTSGIYTPALAYAQLGLVSESPACLTSSVNALL
jgi:hypothetical protein